MVLDKCTDTCGYLGAFIAVLGFGSFGVPIKSDKANKVNIDPLVMQTYKSTMAFLLSFLVLLLGVEFSFTPWGIVSGIFWVPGGTATIYGIRNAGLALTVGIGSSLIVLVSFIWGIFIFEEHVRSRFGACLSVLLMICGIWGMAYFSQPHLQSSLFDLVETESNEGDHDNDAESTSQERSFRTLSDDISECSITDSGISKDFIKNPEDVMLGGRYWSRRNLGIACAIFNGLWGGSIMVPMHFAGSNTKGLGYVISFGIGALLVTIFLWCLRYMYNLYLYETDFDKAYKALPSLHLREMWFTGALCGSLWEIANVGSIISVQFLGEAVGYSVVQSALLVSGLWGIFWFHEIRGQLIIMLWLASSLVTLLGVLLLSNEHTNASG